MPSNRRTAPAPHPAVRWLRSACLGFAGLGLLPPGPAWGQGAAPAPEPAPADGPAVQRVEVQGLSEAAERREASALLSVVGREALLRQGDTQLVDVLRRVPGLSVTGGQGRASEVRLRGLGQGYTLLQVNGEAVPPGFTLDGIPPEWVERVEVLRSATADRSGQAIAGTVNVVLRRPLRQDLRELTLSHGRTGTAPSSRASLQWSGQDGAHSHGLGLSVDREQHRWLTDIALASSTPLGALLSQREGRTAERAGQWVLGLTPRWGWKPDGERSLTVEGLLQEQRYDYRSTETRRALAGAEAVWPDSVLDAFNDQRQARLQAQWRAPLQALQGRLELRAGAALQDRRSHVVLAATDATGAPLLDRTIGSRLRDLSLSLAGKATVPLGEIHTLGLGWDGQRTRRSENRLQQERSPVPGYPVQDLDEAYSAVVDRLALFAQDEFSLGPSLAGYAGLRWEGLRTHTVGNVLQAVDRRASVFSPTAQLRWKLPGVPGRQLRLALSRTYKAPTAKDLVPRRWTVTDNGPTNPNFQGNPALRPELAWGLDLGVEQEMPGGGFAALNLYARRIDGVVRQNVAQQPDGAWVATPFNGGAAQVAGLELEWRHRLRSLAGAQAPDLDLRAALAANASHLSSVPGPDNRLAQQPRGSLNLGADWRVAGLPLAVGASLLLERQGPVQLSDTQRRTTSDRRQLDLYGTWTLDAATRLRLSLGNLLATPERLERHWRDDALDEWQRQDSPGRRQWRLTAEFRLR